MDFIFEEDMDEVGSDIEAYCPKCKADTSHTVITKYEEEVRRVQCSPCGDVHAYRKPRGEVEDDVPEPVAAKKRAAAKKPSWQEAYDKAGNKHLAHARPYTIRDHYHEGDIVSHPKFGVGFVTEISENKAEVTFQDERRVLVHNRPDLAAQMPAIAPVPAPREEKVKSKRGGAKKIAAAEPPAPPAVVPAPSSTTGAAHKPAAAEKHDKTDKPAKTAAGSIATAAAALAKDGKKVSAATPPVEEAKKAAAKKPPEPAKKPSVQAAPVSVVQGGVQGKAARAKAGATKKVAAKGGGKAATSTSSKPATSSKPTAKPAARPTHPSKPARNVRPAARAARAEAASKGGSKLKKKAR